MFEIILILYLLFISLFSHNHSTSNKDFDTSLQDEQKLEEQKLLEVPFILGSSLEEPLTEENDRSNWSFEMNESDELAVSIPTYTLYYKDAKFLEVDLPLQSRIHQVVEPYKGKLYLLGGRNNGFLPDKSPIEGLLFIYTVDITSKEIKTLTTECCNNIAVEVTNSPYLAIASLGDYRFPLKFLNLDTGDIKSYPLSLESLFKIYPEMNQDDRGFKGYEIYSLVFSNDHSSIAFHSISYNREGSTEMTDNLSVLDLSKNEIVFTQSIPPLSGYYSVKIRSISENTLIWESTTEDSSGMEIDHQVHEEQF